MSEARYMALISGALVGLVAFGACAAFQDSGPIVCGPASCPAAAGMGCVSDACEPLDSQVNLGGRRPGDGGIMPAP